MDRRISRVFERNIKYINDLVSVLMTPSHALHPEAEEIFNLCKQTDPDQLALRLANLLDESKNVEIRSRSAILLEEMFEEPLNELTQSFVRYTLLRCVKKVGKERNIIVMKSLCHTIATFLNAFSRMYDWPELFTFVDECVRGYDDLLQEAAMLILVPLRFSTLRFSTLIPPAEVYCMLLESAYANVRIAAFSAGISYIWGTPFFMNERMVPEMTQVLTEGLNGGQEVTTQVALKLLIEWASRTDSLFSFRAERDLRRGPDFRRMQLVQFVRSAFKIAESLSLEKETRHLAIDFLITVRNIGYFNIDDMTNRLFGLLTSMLSDIDNEAASHRAENEDDDAGELRNFSVVFEFLDRLGIALEIYSVPWFVLKQYLAAPKWRERVAAIVALAKISKVTERSFDQLVTVVLALFQDREPPVRLAAINATGQLFTHLDPGLQFQWHSRVLPALAKAVRDFRDPHSRVQENAVSAMVNIIKKYPSPPDTLTVYFRETIVQLLSDHKDRALDQPRRSLAIKLSRQFLRTLPPR